MPFFFREAFNRCELESENNGDDSAWRERSVDSSEKTKLGEDWETDGIERLGDEERDVERCAVDLDRVRDKEGSLNFCFLCFLRFDWWPLLTVLRPLRDLFCDLWLCFPSFSVLRFFFDFFEWFFFFLELRCRFFSAFSGFFDFFRFRFSDPFNLIIRFWTFLFFRRLNSSRISSSLCDLDREEEDELLPADEDEIVRSSTRLCSECWSWDSGFSYENAKAAQCHCDQFKPALLSFVLSIQTSPPFPPHTWHTQPRVLLL